MKILLGTFDFRPRTALNDLFLGLKKWRLCINWAKHDLIIRYKRSWIGIGWVILAFSSFLIAKILIFSFLTEEPLVYFSVYLALGFLIFRFIQSIIVDGCNIFVMAEGWIKSESMPFSIYAYRMILRNFTVFIYSCFPVFLMCIYYNNLEIISFLSLGAALFFLLVNATWVSLFLGIICTRYRDAMHLVSTFMSIMYFLTPVLWVPSDLGKIGDIAIYNPFTHFIAIIREPILTGQIPFVSWGVVLIITLVGLLVSLLSLSLFRSRIVFWI